MSSSSKCWKNILFGLARNEIKGVVFGHMRMKQNLITRKPIVADKQLVREVFCACSVHQRGMRIIPELIWVLLGRQDAQRHEKVLPAYCYNILDAFRKTYFKGFPILNETIGIIEGAASAEAKTAEAASKVAPLNWKNLGRLVGIGLRCIRFAELEAREIATREGFGGRPVQGNEELLMILMGKEWAETNKERITLGSPDTLLEQVLRESIAPWIEKVQKGSPEFGASAYKCSPAAMVEFNEGVTEGMTSFLDQDGRLAGESTRSGIYGFLLFMWPEIETMLECSPRKTITDLHKWMGPFMRLGIITKMDTDTLRDVCAPPPSGIGLSLRPLRGRRSGASA